MLESLHSVQFLPCRRVCRAELRITSVVLSMEYHLVLIYVEVVSDGAEVPKLHRQRWKELGGSSGHFSGKPTMELTLRPDRFWNCDV